MTVGSIVNIRRDLGIDSLKTFGLFLGSFVVSHPVPEGISTESSRQRDPAADASRSNEEKLYLGTPIELWLGRLLLSLHSRNHRKKFYPKNYPLWGGITNMNLNPLWEQGDEDRTIDYFRAVSTGPITPLVLSVTTVRDIVNIGTDLQENSLFGIRRLKDSFPISQNPFNWQRCRHEEERIRYPSDPGSAGASFRLCGSRRVSSGSQAIRSRWKRGRCFGNTLLIPPWRKRFLPSIRNGSTESDIREVLSHAPAPRVVNIHGGIYPVYLCMESFSQFLIKMGYPEEKIRNPGNGSLSFSCYESSEKIAGAIAWYYEKEGLRPMLVGHSQGGIQAVKVLYELTGAFSNEVAVYNPLTGKFEKRYSIIDPITGSERPVVGLQVSYATAVGAGGFTRFLPNQWVMTGRLRSIPDTTWSSPGS